MALKNKTLHLIILFFIMFSNTTTHAQTKAVTEKGDTIYVYDNGTWSYELLDESPEINELNFLSTELKIDTIATAFTYPKDALKEVKNANNNFTVKYNNTNWKRVPPAQLNEDAEFAFQSKKSDVWCIVISEETQIGSENLFKIAKKSMEDNTGAKTEIIKTEKRNVNGVDVIRGVIKASISGIDFVFDSYYYSDENGSVQFTTWTGDAVWKKNEAYILELLNGFIVN